MAEFETTFTKNDVESKRECGRCRMLFTDCTKEQQSGWQQFKNRVSTDSEQYRITCHQCTEYYLDKAATKMIGEFCLYSLYG
jgi:hypothetical protein